MIDRVTTSLVASLAILVVFEMIFAMHHAPVFPWHHIPGYMTLIGFISCVVIVILSKKVGKWFLQESEVAGDD